MRGCARRSPTGDYARRRRARARPGRRGRVSTLAVLARRALRAAPAARGEVEVEACVIGAGVGGLSCARRLAQHGVEALVLERDTVAGGPAGATAGSCSPGWPPSTGRPGALRAERARSSTRARWRRRRRSTRWPTGSARGTRFAAPGCCACPPRRRRPSTCAATSRPCGPTASPPSWSSARSCRGAAQSVWNACLTEHDGALQPALWIRALARAAEQAGARIHERSEVPGRWRRRTFAPPAAPFAPAT